MLDKDAFQTAKPEEMRNLVKQDFEDTLAKVQERLADLYTDQADPGLFAALLTIAAQIAVRNAKQAKLLDNEDYLSNLVLLGIRMFAGRLEEARRKAKSSTTVN